MTASSRTLSLAPTAHAAHAARTVGLDLPFVYRRYGDLVLGRCRMLLRNEADAQDAMQEVFLKLHRFADAFRGESSVTTFLYRVTTTTCLNRLRTLRRRPEDPMAELPEPPPAGDSLLDALALRQLLDLLLRDQDDRTQQCVIYHFVDGMTHDEIGELLAITGAAVRKRIATFRASVAASAPPWLEESLP